MDDIIEDLESEYFTKEIIKEKNKKKKKGKKKMGKKRKVKTKKFNIYLIIISIIWLILVFLNTFLVIKYDVLPFKFLILFLALVVFLPLCLIFLFTKKKIKRTFKLIISIMGIIYIILLSFSFFYLNKTFSFLDEFTSNYNYETKNYMVLVLKTSEYDDIKDLKNEKIGFVSPVNQNADKSLLKLGEVIKFNEFEYDDYETLFKGLDEENIQGVLIGDSYYSMLSEENQDFDSKYRILYNFSLTEKIEEIKKDVDVLKDTFNIYISGIDSYGSVNSLTRNDVNIVVSINPETSQILMINIPRDYYVEFSGTGKKDKLTHAGIYGLDMSVKTIEELLDIEINYYFRVNYSALVNLVDALGGVDVYSKYTFTSGALFYKYQKGYNHVNGEQALEFVRTRKAFADGDRVRGENQQAMIQAIIKKAISGTILTRYGAILDSLKGSFATNFDTDKITTLVKMQLDKMPNWNITSISLSGTDGSEYTYTYPYQKLYVMIPDEETILNAKEKLELVYDGEILDSTYQENSGVVNNPTVNKPIIEKPSDLENNSKEEIEVETEKEEDKEQEITSNQENVENNLNEEETKEDLSNQEDTSLDTNSKEEIDSSTLDTKLPENTQESE